MDTPISSVLQQWRAAQARAHTKSHVTYPPLVPAQQQAVRAKGARQRRMLQMYQRHCTGDPEMDEDLAQNDTLQWCSDLNMADYFECALDAFVSVLYGFCTRSCMSLYGNCGRFELLSHPNDALPGWCAGDGTPWRASMNRTGLLDWTLPCRASLFQGWPLMICHN